MIRITINGVPCLFHTRDDQEAIAKAAAFMQFSRVLFIDIGPRDSVVALVEEFIHAGKEVTYADHHAVDVPRTERDRELVNASSKLKHLLEHRARLSTRKEHPACMSLVSLGEFAGDGVLIIADRDADGLFGAMYAAGLQYSSMLEDAKILDGPRGNKIKDLSTYGQEYVRALSSIPPFDPENPAPSENARKEVFSLFVAMIEGVPAARNKLVALGDGYDQMVVRANEIEIKDLGSGYLFVDLLKVPDRLDMNTLMMRVEAVKDSKILIRRQSRGVIAIHHGKQITIERLTDEMDLRSFVPPSHETTPENGVISNEPFRLHLSEAKFQELISARVGIALPE